MESIVTLSSGKGRKLLQKIFSELRYEKQRSGISVLILLWRICTFERELNKYIKENIRVNHPLGFIRGSSLWMEEVVNRHYFSAINSFVYFGAAILLVLIGIRRFSDEISDNIVIVGIIFEALMLLFMFVVMLFSPDEEIYFDEEDEEDISEELLTEIGEIGKDFALAVVQLEKFNENISLMISGQQQIMKELKIMNQNQSDALKPNPEMIDNIKDTNNALLAFKSTVDELNRSALSLRNDNINASVRKEIEKLITARLSGNETKD
ncbi:MAG: hypothetical protein ACLFR2_02290 [Candidatus Kapaibacterium sp.]